MYAAPGTHPPSSANPARVSRSPTPQGFQQSQPYQSSVSPKPSTGRKRKTPPDATGHPPLPPPQQQFMSTNQQPYQQLVQQPQQQQQQPNPPPQDQSDGGSPQPGGSGGRQLSTSKRAEQNRKAQRAFRERRDQHVKSLESRAQLVDAALASAEEANRRWEECRNIVDQLRAENAALRAALGAVSAAQAAIPHLNPAFAASRTLAELQLSQSSKDQPAADTANGVTRPASTPLPPAAAVSTTSTAAPPAAADPHKVSQDGKDDAS
ncbi:hypothetical protein EXIGLDRAFT_830906 [Exidia glandulosa HHB12029]|uniref:BZIP domain-containing protein n=1 Tax=Exidia glandulosa HHB12029 TaxID=1314781 RepID=A0A165N5T0_EXIGL|nr:hypothetical protein EXIGLDRAFT_830906 [Exidia glandulosa HHB12029]